MFGYFLKCKMQRGKKDLPLHLITCITLGVENTSAPTVRKKNQNLQQINSSIMKCLFLYLCL